MPRPRTHENNAVKVKAYAKRMSEKGCERKSVYLTKEGAEALDLIKESSGEKFDGKVISAALVALASGGDSIRTTSA